MAELLYGDVLLPELTGRDEETYPYLTMFRDISDGTIIGTKGTTLSPYTDANRNTLYVRNKDSIEQYMLENGTWVKYKNSTPPTSRAILGLTMYQIIYTNYDLYDLNGGVVFAGSKPVDPNATPTAAETPTITQNLPLFGKVTYEQGDAAEPLTIAAEVSDGGTLTYQWYRSGTDGGLIDGATSPEYTPPTDEIGSRMYCCQVTNTITEELMARVCSNYVTVTVVSPGSGDSGDAGETEISATAETLKSAWWSGFAAGAAMYGSENP